MKKKCYKSWAVFYRNLFVKLVFKRHFWCVCAWSRHTEIIICKTLLIEKWWCLSATRWQICSQVKKYRDTTVPIYRDAHALTREAMASIPIILWLTVASNCGWASVLLARQQQPKRSRQETFWYCGKHTQPDVERETQCRSWPLFYCTHPEVKHHGDNFS